MLNYLPTRRNFIFGEFELQVGARTLLRDGNRIPLGSKAFEVLTCLVTNAGDVVTKEQLLKTVWPNSFVEESNLSQHVFALRKALSDRSDLIVTIPGRGYQFTGLVRETARETVLDTGVARESGEIVIQTVRERSHMVIEETAPMPAVVRPALAQSQPARRVWVIGIVAAGVIGVAGWAGWTWIHSGGADQVHTVLVADFVNTTGDETFDRALKRALEIDLGQSPSLSVMSAAESVGLQNAMGQKAGAPLTGEVAREVCVRGNRQVVLSGGIASVGQSYLLTLEATDCNSGKKLASAKDQARSKEAVLGALDSIADHVRSKLGESARSIEGYQVPIQQATTSSLDALKAYSMGQYLESQGRDETEFIGFFQRAVELDPQFAMAYGAMANTYYNLNEFDQASAAYKKAFDLSGKVSAREKLILRAHYYGEGLNDAVEAVRQYQLWAATYPQDWVPPVNICNGYTQIGQYAEALPACEQGLKMLPDRGISYSVYARALKDLSRFDEAKAVADRAIQRGKDSTGLHASLYEIAMAQHDAAATTRETQWATIHSDAWYSWDFPILQAGAAAAAGRYKAAVELYRRANEAALHENLAESARDILVAEAKAQLELGLPAAARATLSRLPSDESDTEEIAVLRAQLGDVAYAERYLEAHQADAHPSTMLAFVSLPMLRATLAMQREKPQEAIDDLEPAMPYELANFDVPTLRAAAYLKAEQPAMAISEYKKILANPGIDATSPLYPLAHLGLARAYAAAGNRPASRIEYESFLAAWKDADTDMPLLKAAKAELAKLGRQA